MVVTDSLFRRVQHKAWKVFGGESTDSSNEVAIMEASHFSIGGKHVKIMRPGQSEPFLTVKVLTQNPARAGPQYPDPKPNPVCALHICIPQLQAVTSFTFRLLFSADATLHCRRAPIALDTAPLC